MNCSEIPEFPVRNPGLPPGYQLRLLENALNPPRGRFLNSAHKCICGSIDEKILLPKQNQGKQKL
jgi:hypothetical protein